MCQSYAGSLKQDYFLAKWPQTSTASIIFDPLADER